MRPFSFNVAGLISSFHGDLAPLTLVRRNNANLVLTIRQKDSGYEARAKDRQIEGYTQIT
jgi:hypothetical protein